MHKLVAGVFSMGKFDEKINHTLLVFIPITDQPDCIKKFHPISLSNVIYKIIIEGPGE